MDNVAYIQGQNAYVEAEKAWEASWTLRVIIAIGTYVATGLYLIFLGLKDVWLHVLVSVAVYFPSTVSLSVIKGCRIQHL